MKVTWKPSKAQYVPGEDAFLGRWKVASVHYDGVSNKDIKERLVAICLLPGLKNHLGNYLTVDAAKMRVEKVINYWLKGLEEDV